MNLSSVSSNNSLYPGNSLYQNNSASPNKTMSAGNIASSGSATGAVSPGTQSGSQSVSSGLNSIGGIINTSA